MKKLGILNEIINRIVKRKNRINNDEITLQAINKERRGDFLITLNRDSTRNAQIAYRRTAYNTGRKNNGNYR